MSDNLDGKPPTDFSFVLILGLIVAIAWYAGRPIEQRVYDLYSYLLHSFGG